MNFSDSDQPDSIYISRMFYRQQRKMLRLRTDFIGDISGDNLKWFGGIEFYSINIDTVNAPKLNKGKPAEKQLPYIGGGLYQLYDEWDIIPENEVSGGTQTLLKGGIIFDTRDNEPNPMKGIWTEALIIAAPGFLSDKDDSWVKLAVTHRQYFTLIPRNLNLVYRLSYQGKIAGDMPSYMLPFVFASPPKYTRDGLGGAKNIRGVLKNRVVGEGYVFGNLEMRWKFVNTRFLGEPLYIALSGFLDGGMVVQEYDVDAAIANVPNTVDIGSNTYLKSDFFSDEDEKIHFGYGGGIHFARSENFIVTVNYGLGMRPDDDGTNALYINLDFLF